MSLWKCLDAIFPYIEPLTDQQKKDHAEDLSNDISAINAAKFSKNPERALDEAQRVATAEIERSRTAESKATTYLAVLAALVPLVITLQAATWEDKSGPAPEALKLSILLIATIYVAAAGYHAFRTLQVSGFQRVVERDVAAAWRTSTPLERLTKSTLLASRMSIEEMTRYIQVDSLGFLSIDGLYRAVGSVARDNEQPQYCDACFTGDYPTALTDAAGSGPVRQLSLLADAG